jgi:hypothetical protein
MDVLSNDAASKDRFGNEGLRVFFILFSLKYAPANLLGSSWVKVIAMWGVSFSLKGLGVLLPS